MRSCSLPTRSRPTVCAMAAGTALYVRGSVTARWCVSSVIEATSRAIPWSAASDHVRGSSVATASGSPTNSATSWRSARVRKEPSCVCTCRATPVAAPDTRLLSDRDADRFRRIELRRLGWGIDDAQLQEQLLHRAEHEHRTEDVEAHEQRGNLLCVLDVAEDSLGNHRAQRR